jgi:predicted N-acyltransferase
MARPGTTLAAVLPQLEPALRELGRREKRPLLGISNVATPDLPLWQARHFFASAQSPNTALDLPPTYEHYLETLSTQNRTKIRRTRRRARRFDVRFEHGAPAGESEQLYSMIRQVSTHNKIPDGAVPYTRALLAAMEREMAGEVMVFRGFVEGTFAGHLLCLVSGRTLWWLATGLHYELAHPSYLYFLLMDEMIRWGIEHDIQRVYGGMTSEREKQMHGFHLCGRWFCYRANSHLFNNALPLALPLVRRLMDQA